MERHSVNRLKIARKGNARSKIGFSFFNAKLLREGFSRLDAFGRPISFTYKGRSSYQTVWGACITVLIYTLIGLLFLAFLQDYQSNALDKRLVVKELVNPELSDETRELDPEWKGRPLKLTEVSNLIRFVNLNTLGGPEVYEVEMYRSKQDEARDFDVFGPCKFHNPDESEAEVVLSELKNQCIADSNEIELYETQNPYMYSTKDYYQVQGNDQAIFRVGPCVASASKVCQEPEFVDQQF